MKNNYVFIWVADPDLRVNVAKGLVKNGLTYGDLSDVPSCCKGVFIGSENDVHIWAMIPCEVWEIHTITSRYDWLYLILTS